MSIYKIDINTFCLTFALTGLNFQGELQHVGHMNDQKITVDQSKPMKLLYQIVTSKQNESQNHTRLLNNKNHPK